MNAKADLRAAMRALRAEAQAAARPGVAGRLSEVLAGYAGKPVSGYWPIQTEIDPRPALAEAAARGPVGLPVVEGDGVPLSFRLWEPGAEMEIGAFGAAIPAEPRPMVPELVILPMLAFDRAGGRLGYGGGFYDRTLARLREAGSVLAVGFAYAAQEVEAVPLEDTDMRLDMVVTEREVIDVSAGGVF